MYHVGVSPSLHNYTWGCDVFDNQHHCTATTSWPTYNNAKQSSAEVKGEALQHDDDYSPESLYSEEDLMVFELVEC